MAEHTKGPWELTSDGWIQKRYPHGFYPIAEPIRAMGSSLERKANAERIVACVNGCEGIEDPSEILRDMLDCQERVVNLLEALRAILTLYPEPLQRTTQAIAATAIARAAIAREEKEEQPGAEGCRCVVDMGKMRWVSVIDSQTCGACKAMDGKRVTDQRPPLHDCEHEREGS